MGKMCKRYRWMTGLQSPSLRLRIGRSRQLQSRILARSRIVLIFDSTVFARPWPSNFYMLPYDLLAMGSGAFIIGDGLLGLRFRVARLVLGRLTSRLTAWSCVMKHIV